MEGQVYEAWPVHASSSWPVYFPGQVFSDSDLKVQLIDLLITFWDSPKGSAILSEVEFETGTYILPVDLRAVQQSDVGDQFSSALADEPGDAVSCFEAAAHAVLFFSEGSNLEPGKIKGDGLPALLLQENLSQSKFADGKYSPPTKCTLDGCRSKTFTPVRRQASTLDYQRIRIQENLDARGHEEGRMPRTVECELTEDLVDTCLPGDVVTVCGIVKVTNAAVDTGGKGSSSEQSLYFLYIDAISVVNSKHRRASVKDSMEEWAVQGPPNLQDFTSRDLEFVVRFATENGVHMFRRLIHSVCPSIYGHDIVKAGIVLALFGGVQKNVNGKDKVPIRGDIHVLVVGEPGLGKSQLLQASASVAPRGIYVCGNTTTSAGLTVAVVKDSMTGDYVFEAGAMVLADRGICCIDEFDKMTAEHETLLEAMEQQSVSVAKAGLVASLSSRTSVIAAANPVGGRYNRGKTVNENLKMGAAILSRFDLVYILLDNPNELLDQRLSKHVMALHGESAGRETRAWNPLQHLTGGSAQWNETPEPVVKRLRLDRHLDSDFSPLPGPLLRKYIAYAKQYVVPRMSEAAAQVLQQFYLRLRSERTETPITARQLESLVRLAEARAKLELREEITREDALDVVEIMKESLLDKLRDKHGCLDFSRTGGMSQAKEVKRFMSALQRQSEHQHKTTFTLAELCVVADDISLRVPDLDEFIETINDAGYLLKKGCRLYQIAG